MRLKTLFIIPFAAIALAGCVDEDTKDCDVPDNLELVFTCDDNPAGNGITGLITSVDVFLFDDGEYFLEHRQATRSQLLASPVMRFTVPAGKYHVVAWGNAGSNTAYTAFTKGVTVFDDGMVQIDAAATQSGDPLYYAPYKAKPAARGNDDDTQSSAPTTRSGDMSLYTVNVPAGQKTVKTLDFVRAHRTVNVWIRGYSEMLAGQAVYPIVTTTNRWSGYDFFFQTQAGRNNYAQQSIIQTMAGVPYAAATFHTALGKIDSSIDVVLTSPVDNSSVLPPVNLLNFITVNGLTDTDEIDIQISFPTTGDDLGVTITVPSWGETPVNPGA